MTEPGHPFWTLILNPKKGWRETMAIHEDPDLFNEIKEGLVELKKKQAELYTLKELFRE